MARAVAAGGAAAGPAPDPAFVQAGTPHTNNANAGSHTFAYTCAVSPGSNRLLVLALGSRYSLDTFDAVSYNGVAMTLAVGIRHTGPTPNVYVGLWYLLHANIPNDGASHNFLVDFTAESRPIAACAIEYKNVKQAAPHRIGSVASGGTACTLDLTTVAVGALLIDAVSHASTLTTTPGANQNERADANSGGLTMIGASDKLPAAHLGGTVNMTQTLSGSANKAYVAAAWERV